MMQVADVYVATKTRQTDRLFTYQVPDSLLSEVKAGSLVALPFGRGDRLSQALVVRCYQVEEGELGFAIKKIQKLYPEAPVSEESMALAQFMVERYLSDFSSAIQTVLPPGKTGDYRPKEKTYVALKALEDLPPLPSRALRQQAVVQVLKDRGTLPKEALLKAAGADFSVLKRLEEKGYLQLVTKRVLRRQEKPAKDYHKQTLTPDQEAVYQKILQKTGEYLLCGVTGSGKTEIYLQLVEETLKRGKQAICLVPEISLTPQTIARFEGRFGSQVAILHSRLTVEERYEEWEKILSGQASIAIGARSAIFAPFPDLDLVIIDEEHEGSYVSEKNPKYAAEEIARFRCHWHHCSLVLGSATPSMESLYRADQGEISRLDLRKRILDRPMPQMEIVDMRAELKANNRSMFSRSLYRAIQEALARKEQVILFLNKRGHTSFVFCRTCGYVYRCDACDVAMTYHKHRDRLLCHYCGREKAYRRLCPECGSDRIREFGAGTEQVEEECRRLFPQASIVRADRDTMQAKGAYEKIYADMLAGKIDILIGTQMIAKGFDFPRVSVVGMMAADVNLNLPDLRAAERTFQLITQVAGRAGRADLPGRVYIQSYKPDHYAVQTAAKYDLDGFYREEMAFRKINGYPPLRKELHLLFSGLDRKETLEKAQEVYDFLQKIGDQEGLDFSMDPPTANYIERMNRRYRFSLLLRSSREEDLQSLGRQVLKAYPTHPKLWVVVTLNPLHLI